MDKPTLLNHLKVVRGNYATGLKLYGLLRTLDESVMKGNRVILKEDDLFIVQPGQRLHIEPDESSYEVLFGGPDKWNVSHAALEFSKMLLRNVTNDTFELLHDYCEDSQQLPLLREQPWYHFARLVRNALTHNQRWLLDRPHDLRILPVTWRAKLIDSSMHGGQVPFDFYNWYDGIELWQESYSFANPCTDAR